ncbi:MAG TPA: hypothetical protein VGF89_09920 [Steroidobacteraceae bacterium]
MRYGLLALTITWLYAAPVGAQSLTIAPITDPAYGIKAFNISIPAGWKFEGTVVAGPECSRIPMPVFRAYSPDGLTEMRLLPAFNWTFHPSMKGFRPVNGCLPYSGAISAADFLKHYMEMVAGNGLHLVGPMAVGTAYQQRVAGVAQNMNHISPNIRGSADAAAVRIETVNGTFIIEQRLRAYVECRIATSGPDINGGGCSAHVDVERAPKGKLDALCSLVDAHDLVRTPHEDAWLQRVQQTMTQRAREDQAQLTRQEQASQSMLKRQFDDFMATSQRNHEAFMAQQESSFRSSMTNANAAMNARTTAASDWVDYALDQQTVVGQGGLAKVSNSYSHTWSSTVGGQTQWFQTNDPNANPNGALSGNWTQDTKVHGNGQPY